MAANSENSSRPSLESFRLCVQSICPKFNVSSLKESQFQALYSFICGEEVFVNLPTGSGKSLIFQLAPLVHTWMHEHILSTGDLRHQYGIFGGESQTSLFPFRSSLRDENERQLYSQAKPSLAGKQIVYTTTCWQTGKFSLRWLVPSCGEIFNLAGSLTNLKIGSWLEVL